VLYLHERVRVAAAQLLVPGRQLALTTPATLILRPSAIALRVLPSAANRWRNKSSYRSVICCGAKDESLQFAAVVS
jgi:hypothetical protein